MKVIKETAAATAQKIETILEKIFPEIEFSVSHEKGSLVTVNWEDGPLTSDIQQILDQFRFEYEWFGQRYIGAKHIYGYRHLSDRLQGLLQQTGLVDQEAAERQLIENGIIQATLPQEWRPEETENQPKGRVFAFPTRIIHARLIEDLSASMTPEQKLKFQLIQQFVSLDQVADYLNDMTIDEMFRIVAEQLYLE
ncbi:LPD29 domain-containing protein [Paenibacillus sp. GCM10012307]|uniref:Large polyvalent protein associated domain-containing protein n=1 Tax=Paenibacillus roseus TaxID=2798579 RepID=A0A934MV58_9BACL|nr:LPD29 domain-containing protein [Paenibacillus roseus]MBJ6361767.1 hypothetical protein [Paenibacillus roseus]